MLNELISNNFGSISVSEINFSEKLTVITGETGVGKTMLLNSLLNLLGKKPNTSIITTGEASASSSAIFTNLRDENVIEILKEYDLLDEEGTVIEDRCIENKDCLFLGLDDFSENEASKTSVKNGVNLVVRKTIYSNSKPAKIFINDIPVKNKTLQNITSNLFKIHGQNEQLKLRSKSWQLKLLDKFTNNQSLLDEYKKEHKHLNKLKEKLAKIEQKLSTKNENLSYAADSLNRIKSIDPKENEDEELSEKIKSLSSINKISKNLQLAMNALSGESEVSEDYDIYSSFGKYNQQNETKKISGVSVLDSLLTCKNELKKVEKENSEIETISNELSEAIASIENIENNLYRFLSSENYNPNLEEEMKSRLSDINSLKRVFGPTLKDVLNKKEELSLEVNAYNNSDKIISNIHKEIKEQESKVIQIATTLSENRKKMANEASKHINSELDNLAMKSTEFKIFVEKSDGLTETGFDEVSFKISPKGDGVFLDIENCASGGELSRIMLSIELTASEINKKNQVQNSKTNPVLLFDEIDAGIGGETSISLGKRLKKLSNTSQIIVITHLPQVAIWADKHIIINKVDGKTNVSEVTGEDRVKEIARMLSGTYTDSSIKHARELLNNVDSL